MKIKVLIGVLVFLIAINLGTIGSYIYLRLTNENRKPGNKAFGEFPDMPAERPDLRLNREQRQQLIRLLRDFNEESRETRLQIRELEKEIFQLLQENQVPMKKVEQELKKMSELRLDISQLAIKKMIDAKKFLTTQQQARFFNDIMHERPSIPERRGGFRPPGPSGRIEPKIFNKKKGELP